MERHRIGPEDATAIRGWLETRGGVHLWKSVDLSDPQFSLLTPARNSDGTERGKPHWKVGSKPARHFTRLDEFEIVCGREVKRFRVGLRRGSQGLKVKLTDGATRRLKAALEKAGEGAWYRFDYETQQAVILVPEVAIPLEAA